MSPTSTVSPQIDQPGADLLAAALAYAAHGFHVFPCWGVDAGACTCPKGAGCKSPGKHPIPRNGLHAATTDATQIRNWWAADPLANVAIRTGQVSGVIVVDLDVKGGKNGIASLSRYGKLPPTATVRTGSGGLHLFYATADAFPSSVGAAGLGDGIDVRAEGGYVVAPPSRHVSGGSYAWL